MKIIKILNLKKIKMSVTITNDYSDLEQSLFTVTSNVQYRELKTNLNVK